jgi:hypothetical protein
MFYFVMLFDFIKFFIKKKKKKKKTLTFDV